MKKIILSTALAAVLGMSALAPQAASASDGNLFFNGKITDTTCQVTGGTGTDGATKDITVTLDTVSTSALPAGAHAGDKPFDLLIGGGSSVNCGNGTKVSLHFDGASTPTGFASSMVDQTTGNLKNSTGTGFATNVEIGLLDVNSNPINLWTSTGSPQATVDSTGSATLHYVARYVATGGASTAGNVKTAVMYSVVYN